MRSFGEQRDFKELLVADPDIARVLPREVIDESFDLKAQLRHVGAIFGRVFGTPVEPAPPAEVARAGR